MNGPEDLLNPLYKETGSLTDPTSQLIKGEMPGTDPVSQVALNPQPLPPGSKGAAEPAPTKVDWAYDDDAPREEVTFQSSGGSSAPSHGKRGLVGVIIVVCLIGIVAGLFGVRALNLGKQSVILAPLQPGVIQRQQQFQVFSSSSGGGSGHASGLTGIASCAADTSSSADALVERLIGGGYTSNDDSTDALHIQSLAPLVSKKGPATWQGTFVSPSTAHHATSIAVCLREPARFFGPAESHFSGPIDITQSPEASVASSSGAGHASTLEATAQCGDGEAILGGGYESSLSAVGADWITASYPAYESGVGEWRVTLQHRSSSAISLRAYALCSGLFTTHLEHQALPGSPDKFGEQKGSDWMTCASGTLLTGGYNIATPDMIGGIDNDSPLDARSRTPLNGDFVQRWYVDPQWLGTRAVGSPGEIWVTCWDAASGPTPTSGTSQPTASIVESPTATSARQPTNTPAAEPTATATSQPRPTNTPQPQCIPFASGSGSMDPNNLVLNVEVSAGVGHDFAHSQVQWNQSAALGPINGAQLADLGPIGVEWLQQRQLLATQDDSLWHSIRARRGRRGLPGKDAGGASGESVGHLCLARRQRANAAMANLRSVILRTPTGAACCSAAARPSPDD